MGFSFHFLNTAAKAVGKGVASAAKPTFNFLENAVDPGREATQKTQQQTQQIVNQVRSTPAYQSNPKVKADTDAEQANLDKPAPNPLNGIKNLAVSAGRSVARVLPTVAVSAEKASQQAAGGAIGDTAKQLQGMSYQDRVNAINNNDGLKLVLQNHGFNIKDPSDQEVSKLTGTAKKVAATNPTFKPADNSLTEAVLGKEPVQSYQQRTAGNKQVLQKSRLRSAATPLSLVGLGLTLGGDATGVTGGPEKEAATSLVTDVAQATTEAGVKKVLADKVAPDLLNRIAPALSSTKDPHIVTSILQRSGVDPASLLPKGAPVAAAAVDTAHGPTILPGPAADRMNQTLDHLDSLDTSKMPAHKLAEFNDKKAAIRQALDQTPNTPPTVNPAAAAIDQHLQQLNTKRANLIAGGASETSPAVVENAQAYKDALAQKAKIAPIVPDTTIGPTTVPSANAPISDIRPTTPAGLTEATAPGSTVTAPVKTEAQTIGDTIASKLRGTPASLGESPTAGLSNLQRQQAAANATERSQRIAQATSAAQGLTGEAALKAKKAALAGTFDNKVNAQKLVESVQSAITPEDYTKTLDALQTHPGLSPYEQVNAASAWQKFYKEGKLPTPSSSALWDKALGSDFTDAAIDKTHTVASTFKDKAVSAATEAAGTPKALMASYDFSGAGRQGGVLGSRFPKEFGHALQDQFKYFGSSDFYDKAMTAISTRANKPLYDRMGIDLTGVKDIGKTEEQFTGGDLAEKIPIIGKGVKASDRAYTGVLTQLRADAADHIIGNLEKAGVDVSKMPERDLQDIGKFINTASGRGDLGSLEKHATSLQTALFSPRLWKSRLDMLNPVYYAKLTPTARKYALQSAASFAGIATAVLGIAAAAGAQVGTDPRSSDFGKIKVGNTRYDILGGFQQNIRLAAQIVSGEKINTANGEVEKLSGGFGTQSRWNVLSQFVDNKANPLVGGAKALLSAKDPAGNPVNPFTTVGNLFVPLSIQDAYQGYKDTGAKGVAKSLPGLFGAGVQTYQINITNTQKKYLQALQKKGADPETVKANTEFFETLKTAPTTASVSDQLKAAIQAGDQQKAIDIANSYNKKYAAAFKPWATQYGKQYGSQDLVNLYNKGKIDGDTLSRMASTIQKDKVNTAKGVVPL